MKNYSVTRLVTGLGYAVGLLFVTVLTIAGYASNGVTGALTVGAVATVLAVPLLMFCEASHALVTIAINTGSEKQDSGARAPDRAAS